MKTQGFVPLWLARLRSVVRRILSPWSSLRARLPFQNLQVEVVQRKAFARASFKICELKMWKRSFQREFPSKSASWSCAMEAFVRDFLQNLQVKDVKTKLSWKTSDFQNCSLQGTVLCSHCFIAVIVFLQSSFFAVIPLCSHCSLQSLCFAIIVLCSHGSLRSWPLAVLETDASGRPAERLF